MENKIDLVVVPFHDYKKWINEGFRTRDAHLFEEFRKNNDVNKIIVINRPVSLAEMLGKRRSWKTNLGKKIASGKKWQLNKVDEKTYFLDLLSLDFFKVLIQRKKWWNTIFREKEIIDIIRNALNTLEMDNRVLFLENPMAVGLVGKIDENKFVFDAIDNWLYHPQMSNMKNLVEKNYNFIGENADLIFTVSESLKEFFDKKNKNVFWIPNGVDSKRFCQSMINDSEKREKPVIGYMGKIQDRVDFDLIEKCLKTYEKNKFLIIGPIYSQKEKAEKLKNNYTNIEFLGDIHYNDLPNEMKKFDIAIIPHKVDNFTNSMNPLKIFEYLAAGKQIVTTQIAGVDEFSEYVYQSNSDSEFVDLIQKAINNYTETDEISKKVLEQLKNENFWNYKTNQMIDKFMK